MKKHLFASIILTLLLTVGLYAQRRPAVNQTATRKVQFAKLSDYVNDYNHRRNGERLIVGDVPSVTKITYDKAYTMYSFQPDEAGDVGNTFYASPALAKSLRSHLKADTKSLRVTCVLVEFAGEFDVYRSPFATKIEGLGENGEVIWTATGTEPAKLKIRQ